MKRWLIFGAVACYLLIYPVDLDAKTTEPLIVEKTLLEENITLLEEVEEYRIVEKDEVLLLERKGVLVYTFLEKLVDINLILQDGVIYVFGTDSQILVCYTFSNTGELIQKEQLLDFQIVHTYQVEISDGIFVFGTALSEEASMSKLKIKKAPQGKLEVFVAKYTQDLTLKDIFFFGGSGDEIFQSVTKVEENWWIVFQKDQVSSGDFGNAGIYLHQNLGIFQLNAENEILDFVVLQDQIEEYLDIIYVDKIYLVYDDTVLMLDVDFTQIKRVQFEETIQFVIFSPNNTFFLFLENNILEVLDKNLSRRCEKQLLEIETKSLVKTKRNVYYHTSSNLYRIDVILLENYEDGSCSVSFCLEYDFSTRFTSFFEESIAESDTSFLRQNRHGVYTLFESFQLASGYQLKLEKKITVHAERNITKNGVYPYGYKVLFSGRLWINNIEFLQNDALLTTGLHEVRSVGEETEETFQILVSLDQSKFEEDIIQVWDSTIDFNTKKLYIEIKEIDIASLYANEMYYEIQTDLFGKNYIVLDSLDKPGVYLFHIFGFVSKEGNFLPNYQTILLRVIKPYPKIDIQVHNEKEMQISLRIEDEYVTIRGIYIENDETQLNKKIILKDKVELLWNLDQSLSGINSVYLIVDLGDKIETYIPLYQAELKGITQSLHLGSLQVLQKTTSFEVLRIDLKETHKSAFSRMMFGKEEMYINEIDYKKTFLIGCAIGLGVGLSTFFLLLKYKKQQRE